MVFVTGATGLAGANVCTDRSELVGVVGPTLMAIALKAGAIRVTPSHHQAPPAARYAPVSLDDGMASITL